ncbi:MAG: NADP-specific glutamate dehydrogenase [Clostridia bacterium]|nr:NADP-specific glutamate dehydrogenase [Clostridia bacterium]
MNEYIERVLADTRKKNASEPEFVQTVEEVLHSLEKVIDKHPEYEEFALLERLVEPERQYIFRVPWLDDEGKIRVNRGYRIQFNSAIGPYKGGLRFHPTVYIGMMKFLGFEQTFKNSLTTLPLGGCKGGSDFDPKGKSDNEIMRFCQSYMTELYRYIGPDVDIPAGDIGVGAREIGYLFGQYKRIRGSFENGVLTGKGLSYGGSLIRPEATGYGAIYYGLEVLNRFGDEMKGKIICCSGYGNVTWGVCKKAAELGAKVVTISGRNGYVYDPDGVTTEEKLDKLLAIRSSRHGRVEDYVESFPNAVFYPGEKPWGVRCDIAMPCATQNEVSQEDAEKIVANGTKYYFEVSNMPTPNDTLKYLQKNVKVVAPSKAVNAGGVAVSGLEMCQNSERYSWTADEVDAKLKQIMKSIHDSSAAAAEQYGLGYNLVAGANIAGFKKVAEAMMSQGVV